jgi:hypothetical protein
MDELRKQLFNLAILHGLKACYSTLDSLRDDVKTHGQFLIGEFNSSVETQINEVSVESSIEEAVKVDEVVQSEIKLEKVRKPKVKKVKDGVEQELNTNKLDVPVKGNAKKRWQREQESLKRLELQSKGIFKHDVLTIENVGAWIEAGRSYADIARNEVGCTEEEVSRFCKQHSLK